MKNTGQKKGVEKRTYYFDLSGHFDQDAEFHVFGSKAQKLERMDEETLQHARENLSVLKHIPSKNLTHIGKDLEFKENEIHYCYVAARSKSDIEGKWSMPLTFTHFPQKSIEHAHQKRLNTYRDKKMPVSPKLAFYGVKDDSGLSSEHIANAYLEEDNLKTSLDHASNLIGSHPELMTAEPNTAAAVDQKNKEVPETHDLAQEIKYRPATEEPGGWAQLKPYINPETKQPYLDSKGQKIYFPEWSQDTLELSGHAMSPSMENVKDDSSLGVNVTNLSVEQENQEMQGKMWKVYDGNTTVKADSESRLGESAAFHTPGFVDQSVNHGYRPHFISMDNDNNVTVKVQNWYVRFLGLYFRFLDANDKPIKISSLPERTLADFPGHEKYSGEYDIYAKLAGAEFEILSIPIKSTEIKYKFNMPEMASKVMVLAGGLGVGSNHYPDTTGPGIVMTSVMNYGLPSIMLGCGAATAYAKYLGSTSAAEYNLMLQLLFEYFIDDFADKSYDDKKAWINMGVSLGTYLLSKSGTWLVKKLLAFITEAEAEDNIPFVGWAMQAIAAAGITSAMAQTTAEILNSPKTYKAELVFTHDIEVTIYHDPKDYAFPATADHYELTAMFDYGTPWTSGRIEMPGTTVSDPIKYTFKGVPQGGNVNITVGFYSNANWLAGKGSTGVIENMRDSCEITIKEYKVPLDADTTYSHKEIITLNKEEEHIWQADKTPPSEHDTRCENHLGELCDLTSISISQHYGAIGYTFKSYSKDADNQVFQIANISAAQYPQKGYARVEQGPELIRVAYDLMSSKNNNYYVDSNNIVRQILLGLDEPAQYDTMNAWGRFNFTSDAFLLHPMRKLVSINAELNKIEILELPDKPTTDDKAPLAQAYSGTGIREGLVKGPLCGAVSPKGVIYILESRNYRIQAFDVGINPVRHFEGSYYYPLKRDGDEQIHYLDMAVEYTGYIYVLSYVQKTFAREYRLDIYDSKGRFLCRTTDVVAAKLTVDFWRNMYTLNYKELTTSQGYTEPTISEWIPSTPTPV